MSKLDSLIQEIDEYRNRFFDYNRDFSTVLEQIENLDFLGEIDHDSFYMLQIEQVWVKDENGNKTIHSLTSEEIDELFYNGGVAALGEIEIANAIHWYVNLKEEYVKAIVSTNYDGEFTIRIDSPKDIYGEVFENASKPNSPYRVTDFVVSKLEDENAKSTFEKLIKVVKQSNTARISQDFDERIKQNMSFYWGNIKHKERLIDDEYQETDIPELIEIPRPHKYVDLRLDRKFFNLVHGAGYDEINYKECGYIKQFLNATEASDYFYSAIDYVNNNHFFIKEEGVDQHISKVEKHCLSNKWPIAETAEESERLKRELTKFEVGVTKFHDEIILKLEVWEMGIVYIITNVWDARSVN